MLPASSAAKTMPVLPRPGRYRTGACSAAVRATISPRMYDSVKRLEPTTSISAANTSLEVNAISSATAQRSANTSERLDDLHHAPARRFVGQSPGPRRHVVGEVLRLAGGRDDAGDRRIREDVLEKELRPAPAVELRGPGRERLVADPREEIALRERPVRDDGHTPLRRKRQDRFLRGALADGIVDLHEVVLAGAQQLLELRVRP